MINRNIDLLLLDQTSSIIIIFHHFIFRITFSLCAGVGYIIYTLLGESTDIHKLLTSSSSILITTTISIIFLIILVIIIFIQIRKFQIFWEIFKMFMFQLFCTSFFEGFFQFFQFLRFFAVSSVCRSKVPTFRPPQINSRYLAPKPNPNTQNPTPWTFRKIISSSFRRKGSKRPAIFSLSPLWKELSRWTVKAHNKEIRQEIY